MGRESKKIESIFSDELKKAKNLKFVKDVRNIGAIGVIELTDDIYAQKVQDYCVKNGVWLRPFGKLVYSIVAYIIEENDLRKIVKTMIEAIKSWKRYEKRLFKKTCIKSSKTSKCFGKK